MEFKLIVAGGRDYSDYAEVGRQIMALADGELTDRSVSIVSGMARGADNTAWEFCTAKQIQCYQFPANWNKYGKSAGYKRNSEMAKFADGVLAFWDNKSKGTQNMIETMEKMGKPVWIYSY